MPRGTHEHFCVARKPYLTRNLSNDPLLRARARVERERLFAFAAIPLVVEGRASGLITMFSRHPFAENVLDALKLVVEGVALAIEQARGAERIARLLVSEREAREQAVAALHARDQLFLLNTHDLKNPVTSIKGNAQLLRLRLAREAYPGTAWYAEGLEQVEISADRIVTLIDAFFDRDRDRSRRPAPARLTE